MCIKLLQKCYQDQKLQIKYDKAQMEMDHAIFTSMCLARVENNIQCY